MEEQIEKEVKKLLEKLSLQKDTVKAREIALTIESLVTSYARLS